MSKKAVDQILSQEMSRKKFLATLGAGALSLIGVSALLGALTHGQAETKGLPGYGESNYGP